MEKTECKHTYIDNNGLWVFFVALIIRLLFLVANGNEMYLYSDDNSYLYSAVFFGETGKVSYASANTETAVIMPGMPIILSAILALTGMTDTGLLLARVPFILMGCFTVYNTYVLAKIAFGKTTALIAGILFALYLPFAEINLLFLTETPIMFGTLWFVVSYLKWMKTDDGRHAISAAVAVLFTILFKPLILITVLIFVCYQVFFENKEKRIIRIKFCIMLFMSMVILLLPWWVRNYNVFQEFIPFTNNGGDAMLLGTYQGYGYPEGTYNEAVELANSIASERKGNYQHNQFAVRGEIAASRIKQWFQEDPISFFVSNFLLKPYKSLNTVFYWIECLDISAAPLNTYHRIIVSLGIVGLFMHIIRLCIKRARKMQNMLVINLIIMVFANGMFYAYTRYQLLQIPFICIIAASTIQLLVDIIEKGKKVPKGYTWILRKSKTVQNEVGDG